MPPPISILDIDLSPLPGKAYTTINREWREEFIYFLLIDRFHDGGNRTAVATAARSGGIGTPNTFYGGKIAGITKKLDYIAGLGCTTIWLSPVFENNPGAYHGYNINNYLQIDPNFGTKQDLIDLVDACHSYQRDGKPFPIRVVLDVVINHSGDNWQYPFNASYNYFQGQQFPLDMWRRNDRPVPIELRDEKYYHRRGQITSSGWDTAPENKLGDLVTLKDFVNDDTPEGDTLINILIKAHCYWIREADIDGFRVDAVKHMSPLACSRFSSNIREYAYSLGKRGFFLFGELATADDDAINSYIGQNTSVEDNGNTVFFGLDSVLDFRLAENANGQPQLRNVLKGSSDPKTLFDRLEAQRNRALNRGEIGRYLVTFVDNHDSFWQDGRFGYNANDEQVIAAAGFLLCALGTPCLYYGTEQGFYGHGGDNEMREAMFDAANPGVDLMNASCRIYQEIAKIAAVTQANEVLKFGRMYYREISGDGIRFGLPFGTDYTLAFSRMLYGREVLIAYNVSSQARNDYIVVDKDVQGSKATMRYLYGGTGSVNVRHSPDPNNPMRFVQIPLQPFQFVVLE